MKTTATHLVVRAYRAPSWLPGGHAHTIYAARLAACPRVTYRRETWDTPDGDQIAIDFADPAPTRERHPPYSGTGRPEHPRKTASPLVVLFHGLEGDSQSHYARATMAALQARGWRGAVVHFRGCGGLENRLPRAYHSGDDTEIDWILKRMRQLAGEQALHAVGISLGGNALATWAGRRGAEAASCINSAVAVSAPQDLAAGAAALAKGFSRLYAESFLRSLRLKAQRLNQRHPGLIDTAKATQARTFHDFDDAVTAPLHGFRNAQDYWSQSSCRRWLRGVELPLLMLNARNDPFLPESALAAQAEVSKSVRLEYPANGGHVGFPSGLSGYPGWLPERVLHFFDRNG